MVKRKWLWGKKASEKIVGETESSGSMSSHSDKLLEDQELSKGSTSNSQSQEVNSKDAESETNREEKFNSKDAESETNREETNEREQSLSQKLSDAPGYDGLKDSISKEKASVISINEDIKQLSDVSMDERSKGSFPSAKVSTVSMEETQVVKVAFQDSNGCVESNESLKLLTEKLSAALVNVSLKDDLVKQHSKVAEEAVAGWERADNEAAILKHQLEAAMQKKSSLEDRVSHLDEALKECVRQLRLARDEQERKINQAVAEKTNELEIAKSRLEDQLVEFKALLETSRMNSPDTELQHRVDFLEEENVVLRQELQSLSEELELRTIERDLSTKAAETASKQNLDSIKKVARLEAECRKLKSLSRVSSSSNERKSSTVAASCAESLTDSQSDGAEQLSASECDSRKMNGSWASALIANQFKSEKVVDRNMPSSSVDINLMDDFLEMERLAALPDSRLQVHSVSCDKTPGKAVHEADSSLRIELESMARRTAELEENVSQVEAEKAELAMALAQVQSCFEESQVQLIETQMKLEQLERELCGANEGEQFYKALFIQFEREANLMSSQIKSMRAEIEREQALSEQKSARCKELEDELERKEEELEIQQDAMSSDELKRKEMALVETQDSLEKSEAQLKQAEMKLEELEKELKDAYEEKKSLNSELESVKVELQTMSSQIKLMTEQVQKELLNEQMQRELEKELQEANGEKKFLSSELDRVRAELQTMSSQIEILSEQVQKEQALVAELSTKSEEMEYELQRKTQELDVQQRAHPNNELKIKQEDLAMAAGKLADCQQTIASLGSQLKSLATLEDFLIDTASIPGFSPPAPLMARRSSGEPWKLHSNDTYLSEKEHEPLHNAEEDLSPFARHNRRDTRGSPASSSSSTSSAFFLNYPDAEKNGNGFANFYSLSRS